VAVVRLAVDGDAASPPLIPFPSATTGPGLAISEVPALGGEGDTALVCGRVSITDELGVTSTLVLGVDGTADFRGGLFDVDGDVGVVVVVRRGCGFEDRALLIF
jgi:hypothetical protein